MNQAQVIKNILKKEWAPIYQLSGDENISDLINQADQNDESMSHLEVIEGGDSLDIRFALETAIQAITLIKLCIDVYKVLPKASAKELIDAVQQQYSEKLSRLNKVANNLPCIVANLVDLH